MLFLACSMISVAASAAVSPEVPPAAKLSAAQIVDRNVAARGGLEAWRAVNTLTLSGEMDAGGKQDSKLPFVMTMKRPHMSRLEIRFQDQTAVQVYDGAQGWKVRPFLNRSDAEPFTPTEIKSAESWAELDGPLIDYAKKGSKVELLGAEPVEGHNAYKIKLTLKDGEERNVWIDAASFLELKIDGEPRRLDGKMRKVAIYYRDYKTENGLTMPRVLETAVEGVKQTHKMNIKQVAVGQPADNALFAKPLATVAKAPGTN
jgi:outer membrane lipoprotein-sorting protein